MPVQPTEVTEVSMPELGESITFGTVTRWLKNVGDSVDVGEPVPCQNPDHGVDMVFC
ncbi:hypothetical protein E1288_41395 [Saccharopolyspora elongata]|uniref:Lipoyl-binding domain-containing protein n=1 Tax=Saccharopolyspora elongata TaxID=2530387 RepID=A0A4R4XYW1_9PSEU|nr:hypothetical protein E1288_41395 [Saccharopolyspora elongata]